MTRQASLLFIAHAAPHACFKNQPAKWLCSLSAKGLMTQAFDTHGEMDGYLKAIPREPSAGAGGRGYFTWVKGRPSRVALPPGRGSDLICTRRACPCSSHGHPAPARDWCHWGCSQPGRSSHLSAAPWLFWEIIITQNIHLYSPRFFKFLFFSCINPSFLFFSPLWRHLCVIKRLPVTFTRLTGHATSQMNLLYSWQITLPEFSGSFTLFD